MGWLSPPILLCDIEPWCRDILRKHWPDVPIEKMWRELHASPEYPTTTSSQQDPCQPFSVAGKREGKEDDRHLWPSIRQIVALKDPLGSFWKMFMVTSAWVSTKCLLTWKPKLRQPVVYCSSLRRRCPPPTRPHLDHRLRCRRRHRTWHWFPTPTATDNNAQVRGQGKTVGTKRARHRRDAKMWLTLKPPTTRTWTQQPMLSSEVKLWPTPTSRDHKGHQGGRIRNGKVSMDTLDVAVQHIQSKQEWWPRIPSGSRVRIPRRWTN